MIRSRDEAITRTYSAETAPIIAESLLDESTYLTLNRFDLLPVESAFFSSLCSGFGPLLTVGDTPTG